jgi:hypothetical protein
MGTLNLYTKNDLIIQCVALRALNNGYLVAYAQDRIIIAKIMNAVDCREIESHDILHLYEDVLKAGE